MNNGCYTDLSNEAYHESKTHVSRSVLMDFARSPYTYWAKHLKPSRPIKETTAAMKMGSAFHTLILEPDKFNQEFAILPTKVVLKNEGRDAYEAFKSEIAEIEKSKKTIISGEEWFLLCDMKSKLNSNKEAMQLIEDARIENSFFWKDEQSEMLVKARPDILHENIIVDLKTCSDASPRAFQNSMMQGGYHIQSAMIRDGVQAIEGRRINNVINICIENKYPFNTAIYIIDEYAIDAGEQKYKEILIALKHAIRHNTFEDYGVQTIGLPRWAT